MANLTFSDLQNEVYAHSGLDSSDSTNTTNVNRWINYTQQDICARYPWPFMQSRESIVTVPDYSTGTVSINSGSQTVTGTGTTFTATQGNSGKYYIQFAGSNDWYLISAYNSATSLNIENNYLGSSNLTNVKYIIRRFFYTLSNSADRIVDIRNWNTPVKLIQVDARTIDDLRPNPQSTDATYGYIAWSVDSAGNIQIQPYPFPTDQRELEVRTIKRPTDMVSGSDSPSVPNKYAHLISWGAISIAMGFLRKFDAMQLWDRKFSGRLEEMKREYRISEDSQGVLRSIDSMQRARWIQMPEQYPVIPQY